MTNKMTDDCVFIALILANATMLFRRGAAVSACLGIGTPGGMVMVDSDEWCES